MGIQENIRELKSYVGGAPEANRSKINHIIKLYEDRRIATFNNALSKTLLLASGNEHTVKSGRAEKEYQKIVAKFGHPPRRRLLDHPRLIIRKPHLILRKPLLAPLPQT